MTRHLILVGLSGAGKSTVGAVVASALGAPFVDLDAAVEAAAGRSVAAIFERDGEAGFRALERQAMLGALAGAPAVIAAGGGWIAQPGNLEDAAGRATVVHLRCSPDAAAARLAGARDRPLLAPDAPARLRALHAARAAHYARADLAVETDGRTVPEVAAEVVELARSVGAW